MTRYHVTISSDDRELMLDLVRKLKVQVFDHGVRQTPEEGYIVHALVEDQDISALAAKGYKISRNYDVDNVGILRQAEVGKMNRYIETVDKAMDLSAGILTKSYLNIHEVESALEQAAASPNTTFTELITLPNPTWEGRQSQVIKLGNRSNPDRIGVYFLGGVHAREWGSSDILVNFIESVSKSYRNNTGLSLGGKDFAASEIQSLINKLDIIIFPQVNPDGRNHSMTSDAMWRKNRRPAPPDHPGCIGVDLNRNYNFLWNYPLYFSRDAGVHSSIDPCDYELYIGPGAASEPETQNVVYIMDNNSHIRFFIDLHSSGEDILYSWGDSEDQTINENMNFHNHRFDGLRGDKSYKEFISTTDRFSAIKLAQSMALAIKTVRGREYAVRPSITLYPTSGASDDYSFSRHFVDNHKGKIISYTIEWGRSDNITHFHPPMHEMQYIIQEIIAGLVQFCINISSD